MITLAQYFGAKPHTPDQEYAANDLLRRVEALVLDYANETGHKAYIDPDTGTEISGSKGGAGDGGFRLPTATTGRPLSSHREAKGVDRYDPREELDDWLDEFEGSNGQNTMLERHGLYREAPQATPGWCHLTTRAPGSGRRTFIP